MITVFYVGTEVPDGLYKHLVIPLEFIKCSNVISAAEVALHTKSTIGVSFLGAGRFLNVCGL